MGSLKFPHIFRIISRILVVILILTLGSFSVYSEIANKNDKNVLGASDVNLVDASSEINRLQSIIEKRPDYAAAWLRLAVLYERTGEKGKSLKARSIAQGLNSDLK